MCTTLWKQNERRKHKEFKQDREETWSGLKSFLFFTFYVSEENSWLENSRYFFLCVLFGCWKVSTIRRKFFLTSKFGTCFCTELSSNLFPCAYGKNRALSTEHKNNNNTILKLLLMIVGAFFFKKEEIYISLYL